MRFLLPFLIFAVLAFFLWRGLSLNNKVLPSPLIGKKVPQFELPTLQNPHELINQNIFQNTITVLNVFASWCVICQTEHHFWMQVPQKGITLVGLNYHDVRETVQHRISQAGNPYQLILFDEQGKLGMDLGVYGTPETFIIDKKGIIRYRHVGAVNEISWKNELLPIIQSLK